MASGAIRNHDLDSLAKGFEIVGYPREEVENRSTAVYANCHLLCLASYFKHKDEPRKELTGSEAEMKI